MYFMFTIKSKSLNKKDISQLSNVDFKIIINVYIFPTKSVQ